MPTTYLVGGEDSTAPGTPITLAAFIGGQNNLFVSTVANTFRTGFARNGIGIQVGTGGPTNPNNITLPSMGNLTDFWITARVFWNSGNTTANVVTHGWKLLDANGVTRLQLKFTNPANQIAGGATMTIEKVTAAGVATTLATVKEGYGWTYQQNTWPDKLDIHVSYGTSGSIQMYLNNMIIANSGTADLTTDANTVLSQLVVSNISTDVFAGNANWIWSEIYISDTDTRSVEGVVTQTATSNGNTNTFDSSAAANVNANVFLSHIGQPDSAGQAGAIDEYNVSQSMPATNTYSVETVVLEGLIVVGPGGPQHAQLMVRTGGTDYVSGTLSPASSWRSGRLSAEWPVNPNTALGWLTSDLAAASIQYGVKALA